MRETRLSRVVLEEILRGLLAAGYPVRTRYNKDAIVYFAPVGGYSHVRCCEYDAKADTWRVYVRHYHFDTGGGRWMLPPGVSKPEGYTDGRSLIRTNPGGYSLEFSFARSDTPTVAPWIVSYIIAEERGEEPEPYPSLAPGWKGPPSGETGYLWTQAGIVAQDVQDARRKEAQAKRTARMLVT